MTRVLPEPESRVSYKVSIVRIFSKIDLMIDNGTAL